MSQLKLLSLPNGLLSLRRRLLEAFGEQCFSRALNILIDLTMSAIAKV